MKPTNFSSFFINKTYINLLHISKQSKLISMKPTKHTSSLLTLFLTDFNYFYFLNTTLEITYTLFIVVAYNTRKVKRVGDTSIYVD